VHGEGTVKQPSHQNFEQPSTQPSGQQIGLPPATEFQTYTMVEATDVAQSIETGYDQQELVERYDQEEVIEREAVENPLASTELGSYQYVEDLTAEEFAFVLSSLN
jgi:hypothetical protein